MKVSLLNESSRIIVEEIEMGGSIPASIHSDIFNPLYSVFRCAIPNLMIPFSTNEKKCVVIEEISPLEIETRKYHLVGGISISMEIGYEKTGKELFASIHEKRIIDCHRLQWIVDESGKERTDELKLPPGSMLYEIFKTHVDLLQVKRAKLSILLE